MRRHEQEIAGGEERPRLAIVVTDARGDRLRLACREPLQLRLEFARTAAHDDKLAAELGERTRDIDDEVDAFLRNEAGDHREQGRAGKRQTIDAAEVVGVAAFPAMGVAQLDAKPILRRVSGFVDSVENAGKPSLAGELRQDAVEPPAELRASDLFGVGGADSRDMGGVDHPGFEERDPAVELDAVHRESVLGDRQRVSAGRVEISLMGEVVNGQQRGRRAASPSEIGGGHRRSANRSDAAGSAANRRCHVPRAPPRRG